MDDDLARWTATQLAALGHSPDFATEPLTVEASHRLFYRVRVRGGQGDQPPSFVVMRSPPHLENNEQFVTLSDVFRRAGIRVPEVISRTGDGYFLLTDLGRTHLIDVYPTAARDAALTAAIGTLLKIQSVDDPAVPAYTVARFQDELAIFREWFVERWLGEAWPRQLDATFAALVANTQAQPTCCVHRDYHSRNLLYDPSVGLGVVDFQDALRGPVSYDLASLLRDCYFRFDEAEIDRWRNRYVELSPFALDRAEFASWLDLTAAQRQLKAVGIFARLELRDGKTSHLEHIAPVLGQLGALAQRYRELAPLSPHLSRWHTLACERADGAG